MMALQYSLVGAAIVLAIGYIIWKFLFAGRAQKRGPDVRIESLLSKRKRRTR